ncbi:endopolyphosphatase [Punctularia strigosozonata HHB-11173 SS5]|uniref:endopolyphosphatase n=1 Tax=Punctularia strigosozonata (strain HHB-11173) TaxID=741275 RepID=UPI00044176D0|nr:endopolyphosphatase [Punctularia strigosozonata HHB-11173 SS5]EIN10626.1 endopolyphosphatase [Punctularia strigosozonata HHB-11173 SS5]
MLRSRLVPLLFVGWLGCLYEQGYAAPTDAQIPFDVEGPTTESRSLRGRFLHITDMHPDPWYRPGSSTSKACHRKKPKKPKQEVGYFGTAYSDCDSPFALTNYTMDFLDKNWADEIDFVIWTGDSARHDNDQKHPRTTDEIYDLNRAVAAKMEKVFTRRGIPVVPSLGNNDVWRKLLRHADLLIGPNSITYEFSTIWRAFVPFSSYQVFQRGGYYSVEVIPNSVAVIALNTMYFFDSNKAVGGCEYKEKDDPGNLQFDWLEVQLGRYRERNMQVWISGHVPPSSGNYWPECYVRYVELSLRFQDTILGHLYGHMNADHFFFLEAGDLDFSADAGALATQGPPDATSHSDLFESLVEDFAQLPKAKKLNHDDYAVVNVAPAVVPNPYLPSFRVYSYNISTTSDLDRSDELTAGKRRPGHPRGKKGDKKTLCKRPEYWDTWRCHLNKGFNSDSSAPSRTNGLWTPLGYAQYYLPEKQLKKATANRPPKWKMEYLTYPVTALHPNADAGEGDADFIYPVPVRHLPRSLRDNTTATKSKFAPYKMEDLTIPSWLKLARRLGAPEGEKLRARFKRYMFQTR